MNIFLAASMKSGSTHIKNSFVRLGFKPASVHTTLPGCVNEDSRVDMGAASVLFPLGGMVFHHHIRAIGPNAKILDMFDVKPIVLVRNVLDSVVSWKESMDFDVENGLGNYNSHSSVYGAQWKWMNEHEKYQWILYNVVPWYFSFFLSWKNCFKPIPMFHFYEDHFKNEAEGIHKILKHSDTPEFTLPPSAIEKCIGSQDGKFNKGILGRGDDLPRDFKRQVQEQAYSWGPNEGRILEEQLLCRRH